MTSDAPRVVLDAAARLGALRADVDHAIHLWAARLPATSVLTPAPVTCDGCARLRAALGADDLPHAPLHALRTELDDVVDSRFRALRPEVAPAVDRHADWTAELRGGRVLVESRLGVELDEAIDRQGLLGTDADLELIADDRVRLVRTLFELRLAAEERVARRRARVLAAFARHVEPAVRALVDDMLLALPR